MPTFEREGASIYYEEQGEGYPLLLFAPGGMRSAIEFWGKSAYSPIVEFARDFRVIAMDQRNAGNSTAPITAEDGWKTFTDDHLALLDYLGIESTHVMGGCIGSSYCLGIIKAAPQRITAAVLQNPIGLNHNNRDAFYNMFDDWASELKSQRSDITDEALHGFKANMFDGEFVFSVSPEFVQNCATPLLICAGNDNFHPTATAEEIARLAPDAQLLIKWREAEVVRETVERVRSFLQSHTPAL